MKEAPRPVSSLDIRGLPPRLGRLECPIREVVGTLTRMHAVSGYAISITFVDDRTITAINRRQFGRSGPTDVISFDLSERGLPYEVVGDIYISLGRARAASRSLKISEDEELTRLVAHGVLHALGYRDDGPKRRRRMELVQEQVVSLVMQACPAFPAAGEER